MGSSSSRIAGGSATARPNTLASEGCFCTSWRKNRGGSSSGDAGAGAGQLSYAAGSTDSRERIQDAAQRGLLANYGCGPEASWAPHSDTGAAEPWQWEKKGDPWELLMETGKTLGKQFAALGVVCIEVFFQSTGGEGRLMSCDSREIGVPMASVCELTKAFARYFPLLAMVVSLLVAVRLVLRSRIYYEMLRYGALIDFENLDPLNDPLFILVLVSVVLALSHFAVLASHAWWQGKAAEEIFTQMQSLLPYVTPTAAFVAFLYESYDIEAKLVPLSKYMEQDPTAARSKLLRTAFVPEAAAAAAVSEGLCRDTAGPCTAAELYQDLVKSASKHVERTENTGDVETARSRSNPAPTDSLRPSQWSKATIETAWPARVLLDARLQDEGTIRFKKLWYAFLCMACILTVGVVFFFFWQARKDLDDIQHEEQLEDIAALAVEVVYAAITLKLVRDLYLILFSR